MRLNRETDLFGRQEGLGPSLDGEEKLSQVHRSLV